MITNFQRPKTNQDKDTRRKEQIYINRMNIVINKRSFPPKKKRPKKKQTFLFSFSNAQHHIVIVYVTCDGDRDFI